MWLIFDKLTGLWGSLTLAGLGLKFLGKGTFRKVAVTLAGMVLFWLGGEMIKLGVAAPRPCWNPASPASVSCPASFSFPSGHTLAAAMAAAVAGLAVGKKLVWALGCFWIVLVSAPRLLAGVHTYADVFGGLVLGMTFGFLAWRGYYK